MATSVDIQKYIKTPDGHVEYFIKVFYDGKEWAVRKRFSDFSILDEYLQKEGYIITHELPPKTFWKRFDKDTLKMRKKELQIYLDKLLKNTLNKDNAILREFLEVDYNELLFSKSQRLVEFKITDKVKNIPEKIKSKMIQIPKKIEYVSFNRLSRGSSVFLPLSKSKSVSFSSKKYSIPYNKKDSFQSDVSNSDRKVSMESMSYSNSNSPLGWLPLKDIAKVEAYHNDVNALWPHYSQGIQDCIASLKDFSLFETKQASLLSTSEEFPNENTQDKSRIVEILSDYTLETDILSDQDIFDFDSWLELIEDGALCIGDKPFQYDKFFLLARFS